MKFSPSKTHGFHSSSTHKSLNKWLEQDLAKTQHEQVEKQSEMHHQQFSQQAIRSQQN